MTESEYQQRIEQLEREVAMLRGKLTAKQKATRYGLVWEDVPEAFEQEAENKIPILEEAKELAITNHDGKPTHIIIEGDNYHALQCLNYTHRGKVDVIYIDPPYNTGKEFIYKDKRTLDRFPDGQVIDGNHPLRHSAWLSFMSKRLELAKNLLSEKGVIFISIDDNEQADLKLLCENIFGGENFIAQIVWERAYAPVNLKKHFSESHDYIICYAKNLTKVICNGIPRTEDANGRYSNPDNDPRGVWKSSDMSVGPRVESNVYEIVLPSGRKVLPPAGRSWRVSQEKYFELVKDNRVYFGETGNNVPSGKRFLSEVKQGMTPMTIWKYSEVGHSQDAAKELKDIFSGDFLFSYPKSLKLIQRVIQIYSQSSSLILDFFAGSGTTLHATMKLNEEDGGKRQCILVQQKEGDKNICQNITYERNRRVINGYTNAKGEQIAGLGNSLKYYRTAFVGKHDAANATDEDKVILAHKAGYLIAITENTLEEIAAEEHYQIFKGATLSVSQENSESGNFASYYTGVYFSGNLDKMPEFTEKLETLRNGSRLVRIDAYIYCLGNVQQFDNEFTSISRITLHAIPQPIIEIYKL